MLSNNDILRRIRYVFDFSDDVMMDLFAQGDYPATRPEISNWMKPEDDLDFEKLHDKKLAHFLNGLIVNNRGKKDGQTPRAEKTLSNNLIFRKIKIALTLRDDDIMFIYELADFKVSKHELSAIFRKPDQKQYRECKDQFLRKFLVGLRLKHRIKTTE